MELYGTPRNCKELKRTARNSKNLKGTPWKSKELQETPKEFPITLKLMSLGNCEDSKN